MKRLLLALAILAALLPSADARMTTVVVGGGVSGAPACNPDTNEVGNRTEYASTGTIDANYMTCALVVADCSGSLGAAHIYHYGAGTDNVKIAVFDSIYQGDITVDHKPDASDTQVADSSWVSISSCSGSAWCDSGASKVGGSVVSGNKYFVCVVVDTTALDYYRNSTTGSNILYLLPPGTWGSYSSPPATLSPGDRTWVAYTPRDLSVYVEIE